MKRPRQHVIGERAETILRGQLPSEWIIRTLPKDYGVDLEVEVVDGDHVTGQRIWIQLKGASRLKRTQAVFKPSGAFEDLCDEKGRLYAEYVPFSLETKELLYALTCGYPLLLMVVEVSTQDVCQGTPSSTQLGDAYIYAPPVVG